MTKLSDMELLNIKLIWHFKKKTSNEMKISTYEWKGQNKAQCMSVLFLSLPRNSCSHSSPKFRSRQIFTAHCVSVGRWIVFMIDVPNQHLFSAIMTKIFSSVMYWYWSVMHRYWRCFITKNRLHLNACLACNYILWFFTSLFQFWDQHNPPSN